MPNVAWVRFSVPFAMLALVGCGDNNQQKTNAPPPPRVTVAKPIKKTTVDLDEYVGRFIAVNSVEIRSRVSGYLEKIQFKDGQIVKQGDLLFTIDRRQFENALAQAQANLTLARSNLEFARSNLARARQLVGQKAISEQTFDERSQAQRNAEASVAANLAAVHQAELDLQFSELRAPITGRIGDRRVSPGNLVIGGTSGTTTLLATIVSIDPIRFEFTFDEAAYLRYERLAKAGREDIAARNASTPVKLKLLDEKEFSHTGKMDFVDNVIDRNTGTIRGRAQFANPNALFTPGMFARVQVPASAPYEALFVPDTAIATEQTRKIVYVLDKDNVARQKFVTLGTVENGLRVIKDGLAADDRVIVNGLMRVRPGVKVVPVDAHAPPGAKPTASPTETKPPAKS